MKRLKDYPQELRPYVFHGLDLQWREGEKQASADCPWCGREGKFSIEVKTGCWNCFVCGEGGKKGGGNAQSFVQLLWKKSDAATSKYKLLTKDRGLVFSETLMHWGAVKSTIDRCWMLPGYSAQGKLVQLYRYISIKGRYISIKGWKVLLPTPTLHHGMFGIPLFDKSKPQTFICEGPWDAMALWEVLGNAKETEGGGLALTSNKTKSLLSKINVVGVPGCNSPLDRWSGLFQGQNVRLLFDSDHPQGKKKTSAGYTGMKRAASILSKVSSVGYLKWGELGYDPELPSGFDVRDFLNA